MMIQYIQLEEKRSFDNLEIVIYDPRIGRILLSDPRGFQVRLLDGR